MSRTPRGTALLTWLVFFTSAHAEERTAQQTFRIHHSLTVKQIPEGAKQVRVWFWYPDDDEYQKVLDLAVTQAPKTFRITRDPRHGHRYLYAEENSPGRTLRLAVDFVIRRQAVAVRLDPEKAGPITQSHRTLLAEYLSKDSPYLEVTPRIVDLAGKICAQETSVVKQARKLFDWVVANTDHYSKDQAPKSSGTGSAEYCLDKKGGGCTDQHALFMALCRARGIPTRIHFGSLLRPQNQGKDVDPGYRCWVQFFVPNYGWVPTDISAANTNAGQENAFFGGLDERRIRFAEGRHLQLAPSQAGKPLNLFLIAHIEVDGRPHTAFERVSAF